MKPEILCPNCHHVFDLPDTDAHALPLHDEEVERLRAEVLDNHAEIVRQRRIIEGVQSKTALDVVVEKMQAEDYARRLLLVMAAALERTQVADDPSGAADEATAILEAEVNLDGSPVIHTWALVYLRPDGWWEAGRGWDTLHDARDDGIAHDWKGSDWGIVKISAATPKIEGKLDLVFGAMFHASTR